MITGIGAALLLAGAAPSGATIPALVVSPTIMPARKIKHRKITVFTAPTPAIDLRRLGKPVEPLPVIAPRPASAAYAVDPATPGSDEIRMTALVASDREARYTGRRIRQSGMAAGLSLRMTNDDGVLASQFGMAGPVGKALSRIALEAMTPD